jgi:prolyl-tRNA synthetase
MKPNPKPEAAIHPRRQDNYPEWYQQVVRAADLAENSSVRGCMVIKPWGYALWEGMQRTLDGAFKALGHQNAYFPLFIPMSYFEREAQHIEGFAKECAVVTHTRLELTADKGLRPASPLEEPLVVRPTSELVIGEAFARWVQSYRDLPLRINQWCNVVRWEMRTRLFLRTAEFLWQEGHTAHASAQEARQEAQRMLEVYRDFMEQVLAIPAYVGEKTASERFPGADTTYTLEAMMQDGKALQAGTSHFLGQHFAKACDIGFLDATGQRQHAWTTSWGCTTRLIGGLVMTHSDDNGCVLPPRVAPWQVVIVPITHKPESREAVLAYAQALAQALRQTQPLAPLRPGPLHDCHLAPEGLRVHVDTRDMRGGDKLWSWIKKGAPWILEVGPRDVENQTVCLTERDCLGTKQTLPLAQLVATAGQGLSALQDRLLAKAKAFRDQHTHCVQSAAAFRELFGPTDEACGPVQGFALAYFSQDPQVEEELRQSLKVSVRCIPHNLSLPGPELGTCIFTGQPNAQRMLFAKAY